MIQVRAFLKSLFQTGDKPTEQDFADLIDSYLHKTEDSDYLGLSEYNPLRTYKKGEGCFKNREVYQALTNTTGTFKPTDWEVTGTIDDSSFDQYDSEEIVAAGQYREYAG
jgi:hypothetical protein